MALSTGVLTPPASLKLACFSKEGTVQISFLVQDARSALSLSPALPGRGCSQPNQVGRPRGHTPGLVPGQPATPRAGLGQVRCVPAPYHTTHRKCKQPLCERSFKNKSLQAEIPHFLALIVVSHDLIVIEMTLEPGGAESS